MFVMLFLEYGGLGLDYSYSCALAEELGNINCGAVPMAIGVQSDMATPALARFVSFISPNLCLQINKTSLSLILTFFCQ